uniref:Uncharacterized protein n=1 Tax=mine drainage metagenome TaxID=410659 RepID=E6QLC3_9ZZZZ
MGTTCVRGVTGIGWKGGVKPGTAEASMERKGKRLSYRETARVVEMSWIACGNYRETFPYRSASNEGRLI